MILLVLLFSSVVAYLPTDTLMEQAKAIKHPKLSFRYEDDILIADWAANSDERVLLVFNEHARERVTAELGLRVLQHLESWNPSVSVTIIPVLNVWGRKSVENGNTCLRKNSRGVDTNRNYQQHPHHYLRNSEEYEGPHPISEKESKLVAHELRTTTKYFNIHSGEYSMYMPYDASDKAPPNADKMKSELKKWSVHCPQCSVGSAATASTYKAYGTSVDWAITHGVSEAYTFEIFGTESWECERMFNPREQDLDKELEPWLEIIRQVLT